MSRPDPARPRRGGGAGLAPEEARRWLEWLDSELDIRDPGQGVEREVVRAEEVPLEAVWFWGDFGYEGWQKHPRVSHARIVYRDRDRRPGEVADLWTPAVLLPPSELARADDVGQLDLAARGGTYYRPYRAAEWICLTAPDEESLLELDLGAPAFYVLREYYKLTGQVVLVDERHLRDDTVFHYDRNLPWERRMLREFFPSEFPEPWNPRDRREQRR